MSRRLLCVLGCVAALATAGSLTLAATVSPYTAVVVTPGNTFTATADWTAPTVAAAAIGRSGAYDTGFIDQGATYYVYADVSDTGNPASGIASVVANVNTVTPGSTSVALSAGDYTAGGTAYGYRSASLKAAASLSAGSHSYTITSTDAAGNAATQSFAVVVDNTAPTALDVQSTNVSGGTVGRLDQGDTLTLTFSETMDPYSILTGWSGASTPVQVALVDGGGSASDYVVVYNTDASPTQIDLGTIYLGSPNYLKTGTYITYGAVGAATVSTITRSGSTITIRLGTPSGSPATSTTAAAMTWTPSTAAWDIAGNAMQATTATQSGPVHVNF